MPNQKKGSGKKKPFDAQVVKEEIGEEPRVVLQGEDIKYEAYATDTGEVLIFVNPAMGEDIIGKYIEGIVVFNIVTLPNQSILIALLSDSAFYMGPARVYLTHIVSQFMTLDDKSLNKSITPEVEKILTERLRRTSNLLLPPPTGNLIIP